MGVLNTPLLLPSALLVSLFLIMHANYPAVRSFRCMNGSPAYAFPKRKNNGITATMTSPLIT